MTGGAVRLSSSGPEPPGWLADLVRLDSLDSLDEAGSADGRFDLPELIVWASVASREDAMHVLRVIQRGADVVLHVRMPEPDRSAFLDEVRRAARRVDTLEPPQLDSLQRELVRHLRHGLSLREAAARLHISGRTADRRLAEIRDLLGVATTSEALRHAADL